ncbi:MAG: hypothetical protein IRY93_01575, partial [Chthoniobacterales bacterium]|nr:hypothetical protein [Chthoniobacterales bacterium]
INPRHAFHIPGAPYYLAAGLLFSAMLLATRVEQPKFEEAGEKPFTAAEAMPIEEIGSASVAPLVEPPQKSG